MIDLAAFLVLTYLFAAVPFGLVVTTLYGSGVDIRVAGSGNIGTTNVGRLYGRRMALSVLALDALKGGLPVVLAGALWPDMGLIWTGAVGVTAVVGHCYPIYLELRGGKGVATAAGVMFALAWKPTVIAGLGWSLFLALSGRSSLAALAAIFCMIGAVALLEEGGLLFLVLLLGVGIAWRHRPNIRRLMRGEETAVIRPVRWGRKPEDRAGEHELEQSPSGASAAPSEWGSSLDDPMHLYAEGEGPDASSSLETLPSEDGEGAPELEVSTPESSDAPSSSEPADSEASPPSSDEALPAHSVEPDPTAADVH